MYLNQDCSLLNSVRWSPFQTPREHRLHSTTRCSKRDFSWEGAGLQLFSSCLQHLLLILSSGKSSWEVGAPFSFLPSPKLDRGSTVTLCVSTEIVLCLACEVVLHARRGKLRGPQAVAVPHTECRAPETDVTLRGFPLSAPHLQNLGSDFLLRVGRGG